MSQISTPPPIPAPTPPPAPATRSGVATASMVCGFLTIPTCFATVLPAIILGHVAHSRTQPSQAADPSRRAATIGLIFGYGSLALIPIIAAFAGLAAPAVIRARQKADQVEVVHHMRQIGIALMEYETDHGTEDSPYPADLAELDALGITTNIEQLLSLRESHAGDWFYFPNADPADPTAVLLISPPIGEKVGVLTVDTAVRSESHQEASELVESSPTSPRLIPAPVSRR